MFTTAAVVLAGTFALDLRGALMAPGIPAELWQAPPFSTATFVPAASGGITALFALAALALRRRPAFAATAAALAPLVPFAASTVLWTRPQGPYGYWFGTTETLAVLLAVTVVIVRHRPAVAAPAVLAAVLTIVSGAWRDVPTLEQLGLLGFLGRSIQPCVMLLVPGCVLRWRRFRQRQRIEEVRREERLAISRELHDVVAHQVTGIVVQVQALRHAEARDDAELVREALPEIEAAGARALAAMRAMVAALRDPGETASAPRDTAAALADLERPAHDGRPGVVVETAGPLADLPPATGSAVARIAQEGVTNALRHARDATRILVRARADASEVRVDVADDGRTAAVRGGGHGYGLVGMGERARLLGGSCTAGPASDGPGWLLRARLPLPAAAEPGGAPEPAAAARGEERAQ
ncbi:histidine kinase [Murinocardiopsis flavida]|uniref:histidine kinase n=2 Tax=Murinocardiopsis flavida TaxID=645275 RepID=A0A2P8DFJ6_9ACTN|nr:histidine kinase [Murinocardiopsis flavida]